MIVIKWGHSVSWWLPPLCDLLNEGVGFAFVAKTVAGVSSFLS